MGLSSKDYKFMYLAMIESTKSDYCRGNTGCVIVYKNTIISSASNSEKTHPMQHKYNKYRIPNNTQFILDKVHAEIRAINKIKYMDIDFGKCKIYVYREKNHNSGLARPCEACMHMIKDIGIKHIYYSTDDGIAYEKIM